MASVQARRPTITALPGASDFAAAAAAHSPLDQLGLAMRHGAAEPSPIAVVQRAQPAPVPTLDLNLFRSPSIYSVESNLDTISLTSEEHHAAYGNSSIGYGYGFTNEPEDHSTEVDEAEDDEDDSYGSPEEGTEINFGAPEPTSTPSTPRAARRMGSDEVIGASGSPVRSGASTPTFRVHRPNQHAGGPAPPPVPTVPFNVRSAVSEAPFALRPVPVRSQRSASSLASSSSTTTTVTLQPRSNTEPVPVPPRDDAPVTRDAPAPHQPQTKVVPDWASVHGEQGSDWGDDEAEFEWLDKGHPEAVNGNSDGSVPRRLGLSPKRLSRIRAAVPNLTPNLAPPSFATSSGSGGSSGSNSSASSPVSPVPPDGVQRMRTKKKRPIVIPRRAAPPPPTGAPSALPQTRSRSPQPLRSPPTRDGGSVFDSTPSLATPRAREQSSPELEAPVLPPVVVINATPDRVARRQQQQHHLMVPLKDGDGGNRPGLRRVSSLQSSTSMQSSLAYSFYDLDDGSATPSRSESPSHAQPRGRYAKIPITTIDPTGGSRVRVTDTTVRSPVTPVTPVTPGMGVHGHSRLQLQSASTTSLSSISAAGLTPDELVAAGLEQRRAGHLPKAAYMFMKAGEAGCTTGQIYYGLALRHGQGVARDERRGFSEILQACDRSLAEGPIDLRAAAGSLLTPQQVQMMTPGLSLGLYEVACCLLDGTGVKRSPDTALEYLRMAGSLGDLNAQEELGLLLAKGGHGVRKDMKESAKWYRAALEQGLNTPGLAWVWKEKYN